ncbi:hypothetical protein FF38_11584, partial [Lucilia cuprina]
QVGDLPGGGVQRADRERRRGGGVIVGVEVHRHGVDTGDLDSPVEHRRDLRGPLGGETVGRHGQCEPHLQRRALRAPLLLQLCDRRGTSCRRRRVVESIPFDVEVDGVDAVPVEHGAIRRRQGVDRRTRGGQLGVEGASERHRERAPLAVHPLDATIELEPLGGVVERVRASPRGRAVVVTRGDDEGEDQSPGGIVHRAARQLVAGFERHVVVRREPAVGGVGAGHRRRQRRDEGGRGRAESQRDDHGHAEGEAPERELPSGEPRTPGRVHRAHESAPIASSGPSSRTAAHRGEEAVAGAAASFSSTQIQSIHANQRSDAVARTPMRRTMAHSVAIVVNAAKTAVPHAPAIPARTPTAPATKHPQHHARDQGDPRPRDTGRGRPCVLRRLRCRVAIGAALAAAGSGDGGV